MTLVETLVAIAILGVSVSTFVMALSAGSLAVRNLDDDALARGLARSQMETIKAADYKLTGAEYNKINTPEGYDLDIVADPDLYSKTSIQKVTVNVLFEGNTVYSLEGYRVDR